MSTLRTHLRSAMDVQQNGHSKVWGAPEAMTMALRSIEQWLRGHDLVETLPADRLQASLRHFVETRQVANFTELKYVCYALVIPIGDQHWRLIDRTPLFDRLLQLVDKYSEQTSPYRRCYHGLLTGYFGFDQHSQLSNTGIANWTRLREFLGARLDPIVAKASHRGVVPDWLSALSTHRNLFTDDPCRQYASDLQNGHTDELKLLCGSLGIPSTSWVWAEALMAYVRAVCDGSDGRFQRDLPLLLRLVNGETELKLAEILSKRATALTVSRYARCEDRPEHAELRDTSVRLIGNPWLNRSEWDAHVQDEPARQMVESWLKKYLIKNFFELLAHDGRADVRRLNYWLKWEPQITDMWFVLGDAARRDRSEAFLELRKRMAGRDRILGDSTDDNNAFVMQIGPLLVIEFGVTGNACYVFAAGDFDTDLGQKYLSLRALKQRLGATRLSHMMNWEPRFDYELRRLLHSVPSENGKLKVVAKIQELPTARAVLIPAPPAPKPAPPPLSIPGGSLGPAALVAIQTQCKRLGVSWEDNRSKNGALWLLIPERRKHRELAVMLESCGFKHVKGRGFWFKGRT